MRSLFGTPEASAPLRKAYDQSRYRKRITISFDAWIDLYRNLDNGHAQVARILGISPSTAKYYHDKYVRPVLGRDGRTRYRARLSERKDFQNRSIPDDASLIAIVAGAAEEADLIVRMIPQLDSGARKRRTALEIEGHHCRLHLLKNRLQFSPKSKRSYVKFAMLRSTVNQYAVHVLVIPINREFRIFVVPSYVFNRVPGDSPRVSGYIPIGSAKYQRSSRIDWSRYENGWHRLEGEADCSCIEVCTCFSASA